MWLHATFRQRRDTEPAYRQERLNERVQPSGPTRRMVLSFADSLIRQGTWAGFIGDRKSQTPPDADRPLLCIGGAAWAERKMVALPSTDGL
jgi:hypothetical protein